MNLPSDPPLETPDDVPAAAPTGSRCPFSRLKIPVPDGRLGWRALKTLLRRRSVLPVLELLRSGLGNAFGVGVATFKAVVLAGPQNCRFLLVNGRDKFLWRTASDPLAKLLPHGMLVHDGDKHDRLRAIMTEPLSPRQVRRYVGPMVACADRVLDGWREGERLDLIPEVKSISLLLSVETLFGVSLTRRELETLTGPVNKAAAYISPGPWLIWPRLPRLGYRSALRTLDRFLYDVIGRRKFNPAGDDLLSALLAAQLSDEEIHDQLLMMLIAGHDTTTALISWVLALLGSHPDCLARAAREAREAAGGEAPTAESLDKMVYLDQVIREAMRLYPPVHVGNRRAPEDVEVDGYLVPKDTRVIYSIYLTHRDPENWPDPEVFNPDRFAAGAADQRTAFAYIPFGAGKRNCIGAAYGLTECKAVVSRILQRFELSIDASRVKPHMGAALEPSPRLPARVAARR